MTKVTPEDVAKLQCFQTIDSSTPKITLIKTANHVFKVEAKNSIYFLKTHTKDWYPQDPKLLGHLPMRESHAWQFMRSNGLSAPNLVAIDDTCNNPIGRPYYVTEMLKGDRLTDLISKTDKNTSSNILRAVGEYLRRMHSITFERPGLLTPRGPEIDGDWHHRIWSLHGFRTWAEREQEHAKQALSPETYEAMIAYISKWQDILKKVYDRPVFVHGDCHAHQFYLYSENDKWHVSGVLDMEVTSAGDGGEDLMKFCAEMSRRYGSEREWWKPFFEGYGSEPDFDLLKLRYLASGHLELSPFEYEDIPGVRELVVKQVLRANSWQELFDLSEIRREISKE